MRAIASQVHRLVGMFDPRVPIGYQFVWWPIFRVATWWPFIHFTRFEDSGYQLIYRWAFMLGPFEVRRWKDANDQVEFQEGSEAE